MGIQEGKRIDRAIAIFLDKAQTKGFEIQPEDNDYSRQLLVDRSSHPILDPKIFPELSPESRMLLTSAVNLSRGKLRVQAYRRPGILSKQTGNSWLELSDPDSRLGLEVVVSRANTQYPEVTTSLPRAYDIKSGNAAVHVADYLMKARSEIRQIEDGVRLVALAGLALGLETQGKLK